MQIFSDVLEVVKDENTYLTIGTFDGLHLGHQHIIDEVVNKAKANNGRSFLITFDPHPRSVVHPSNNIKLLTLPEEKKELLSKTNLDEILVINFTPEFAQLSSEDFIKQYLLYRIGLKEIIIGHDHQFGKNREGNKESLQQNAKKYNFACTIVPPVVIDEHIVSSTKVRNAVMAGEMRLAKMFLNRNYSFSGLVVEGDKRGRTLGFPTANIEITENKVVPCLGIYAVRILVDNVWHNGVMSIGDRPTFYNNGKTTYEVYIINFDEEIYGKFVVVEVYERIRNEIKFNSVNALIEQMKEDTDKAIKILKEF